MCYFPDVSCPSSVPFLKVWLLLLGFASRFCLITVSTIQFCWCRLKAKAWGSPGWDGSEKQAQHQVPRKALQGQHEARVINYGNKAIKPGQQEASNLLGGHFPCAVPELPMLAALHSLQLLTWQESW